MGEIMIRKIKGMNWKAKISLVLIFTMVFSTFLYQGFYKPRQVEAAVAVLNAWTNVSDTNPNNTGGTVNVTNQTVSAGTSRIFVAGVCLTAGFGTTSLSITNVTFGGTALTQIGQSAAANREVCYMGYLKDAQIPAGAQTLAVTYASAGANVSGLQIKWGSYQGVDQTTPINTAAANYAGAATVTFGAIINYAANGETVYIAANGNTGATVTAQDPAPFNTSAGSAVNGEASYIGDTGPQASAGSFAAATTVTFGGTTSTRSAIVVASINPVLDSTPPVEGTLTVSPGTATYVSATFTITEGFTDPDSAISSCQYTIATPGPTWVAATWNSGTGNCTATPPVQADGTVVTIQMRATDPSGNTSTPNNTSTMTVDAVAPTTTNNYPGGTVTSDPTITLTPTDARSGVANTKYCVDQTNTCTPSTVGTSTTIIGTPGIISTWYLRYFSTDNVGNVEATKSQTVVIDHTCAAGQPTGLAAAAGTTTTSINLTWTAASGDDSYNVWRDGSQIATGVATTSYTDSGLNPSTTHSYYVVGHNNAGSCNGTASSTINKSTLATTPSAPVLSNVGDGTHVNVAIGSDTNSTETTYAIRINGGAYTNQFVQAGGTIGASPAWQTMAAWNSTTVTLATGITYTFDVEARNGNGELIVSSPAFGPTASVTPHVSQPSTITSCAGCHGYPPVDSATRDGTTGRFPGSHNTHAGSGVGQYGYACTKCHVDNGTNYAHRTGNINMATPINGDPAGAYGKGTSFLQTNSPTPFQACANVYCHSQGTGWTSNPGGDGRGWTAPLTWLTWTQNDTCTSCHNYPPAYQNQSLKANSHWTTNMIHMPWNTLQMCQACHYATTTDGATVNTTNHVDRNYDLAGYGGGGVWSTLYSFTYAFAADGGVCSTVQCHGGANAKWGTPGYNNAAGDWNCVSCHSRSFPKRLGSLGSQGTIRQVVGAGADFDMSRTWASLQGLRVSRHLFGATTVLKWDCIICHLAGQTSGAVDWGNHNTDGLVHLRNVDTISTGWAINNVNTGSASNWTTIDYANLDQFCVHCHDQDGAAGIAVNNTNNGVLLGPGSWTTRAGAAGIMTNLAPFNTTDVSTGNIRGSSEAGSLRTRITNVMSQFYAGTNPVGSTYNGNPSQHAVLGKRYSTVNANWTVAAWTSLALKKWGKTLNVDREASMLSCADCHVLDVGSGAHGGTASYNLWTTANNIRPFCTRCHNSTVYTASNAASRFAHNYSHGPNTAYNLSSEGTPPQCLHCHASWSTVAGQTGYTYGGIHGSWSSTATYASGSGTITAYRFFPGAYRKGNDYANDTAWTSTASANCYFWPAAQKFSNCSSHDGGSAGSFTPNYSRPTKY